MPRRNHQLSDEDRRRLVESFEQNEDFLVVADTLRVHRCTAYSVIRRFQETGQVARSQVAGGRPPKLDNESLDFLVMLIENNPCITLREMNNTLREIFPQKPNVSPSTVSRALEGELITLKQAHNRYSCREELACCEGVQI